MVGRSLAFSSVFMLIKAPTAATNAQSGIALPSRKSSHKLALHTRTHVPHDASTAEARHDRRPARSHTERGGTIVSRTLVAKV